jgi:hypothetical protein
MRETAHELRQASIALRDSESANTDDALIRLRNELGARTVSRLIEICDDPIPIMGPDLRMAAGGA